MVLIVTVGYMRLPSSLDSAITGMISDTPAGQFGSLRTLDWIDMAQNRDQWRALVNTVLNLRVP
jgi:hypothetical protein